MIFDLLVATATIAAEQPARLLDSALLVPALFGLWLLLTVCVTLPFIIKGGDR